MRFEDLRRAHWIVIAILIGAGMAWLFTTIGGDVNSSPTHSQAAMEGLMYRPQARSPDGKTQYTQIRDITVYPAKEIDYAIHGATGDIHPRKSLIRFKYIKPEPGKAGQAYYGEGTALVDDPYRPGGWGVADPSMTAMRYIASVAKDRPWIDYHYAWWAEPRWTYVLWIGGCVLVLGIIWPTVQEKLIGAGYGTRSSELPEKKESFWKKVFGHQPKQASSSSATTKSSTMTLTQDELDRIAQMEAGLKDFMKSGDEELGGEVDEKQVAEIRKLSAEPIDAPPPPEQPKEEKDYGGEFYPTVAHGKKKPDGKP